MASTSISEIHLVTNPLNTTRQTAEQLLDIVDRYRLHENRDLMRALQGLQKRIAARQLTLAVLSDSSESKSRLIEILLDLRLSDASIPPSTMACTYLAYGVETESAVTLTNSLTARLPLDQLAEFISEKVPASSLQKVLVRFPNAALKDGLVVIDTPPLGSIAEAPMACTATALAEADVCVFVIAARARLSESAIAFLRGAQIRLDKFFFVLEDASKLSVPRQDHAVERLMKTLQQQCGLSTPRVTLLSSIRPEDDEAKQSADDAKQWDAKQWKERSRQFHAKLLEFATINSRASISSEAARLAGETLAHAVRVLRSSGSSLRHARLRRGVRTLEQIVTRSEDLALAENAVMRSFGAARSEDAVKDFAQPFKAAPEVPFAAKEANASGAEAASPVSTQASVLVRSEELARFKAEEPALEEPVLIGAEKRASLLTPEPVAASFAEETEIICSAPQEEGPGIPAAPPEIAAPEVAAVEISLLHEDAAPSALAAQEPSLSIASQEATAKIPPLTGFAQGPTDVIQSTNAPAAMATFTRESFTAWVRPMASQVSSPSQHARGAIPAPERNEALPASEQTSGTAPTPAPAQAPVTANEIVTNSDQPGAPLSTPADAKQSASSSPLRESGAASQDELATAPDSSELPESVKAWYAMPVGPPARPARHLRRRRTARPSGIHEVAAREEQSSTRPDELQEGSASDPASDAGAQANTQNHGRASVWRVVGLGAVAALVLVMASRPHLLGHLTAPMATRAQLPTQHAQVDTTTARRATDALPLPMPAQVEKPSGAFPREGISTPPPEALIAKRSAAIVKADGAPSVRPPHTFYNSRGQLLGVQPFVANSTSYPSAAPHPAPGNVATPQQPASIHPAEQHPSTPYYVRDAGSDPSLLSALNRWVNTFRTGNLKAQVACYAPFVDTYFNWRNVTPEQVQYDKQRAWRKTASVHKYDVTPVSVINQGDGRKAVLLQKDWDTTTTRGTVFSGSEIEKLVFARIEGEWKIVGEQEVKVLKLRRE